MWGGFLWRRVFHISYKVMKVRVRGSPKAISRLMQYRKACAEVWNDCIVICQEHYDSCKHWYDQYELQRIFKLRDYGLPSHVKQQVLYKYKRAQQSISNAIKQGRVELRYPYKKKNSFNPIFDYQNFSVNYQTGAVLLASPLTQEGKRQPRIRVYLGKRLPANIKQIEIIMHERLYACVTYVDEHEQDRVIGDNVSSIDLGEIHCITSVDKNSQVVCITGRKIRSIKRLRNKRQADLYSQLTVHKKGSKRWRILNNVMQFGRHKAKRQIKDAIHKITKKYVDFVVENNISTVVIGDPEGVQRNRKGSMSAFVNQKVSQWEFGEITRILEYKLAQHGIELVKVSEAYTSQKCPICGELHKPKGRNYQCVCGYKQHRDVVGAINILQDYLGNKIEQPQQVKYLRIS